VVREVKEARVVEAAAAAVVVTSLVQPPLLIHSHILCQLLAFIWYDDDSAFLIPTLLVTIPA
jgi:hypothetical protein